MVYADCGQADFNAYSALGSHPQEWWKAFQSTGPNPYEMLAMNDANVSRGMMNAAIVNAPVLNRNADIMIKPTTEAYNADVSRAAAAENAAASRFGTSAGVFGTELGTVGQMSKEALTYQTRANQEQANADQQYKLAQTYQARADQLTANYDNLTEVRRREQKKDYDNQFANLMAMSKSAYAAGDQYRANAETFRAQATGAQAPRLPNMGRSLTSLFEPGFQICATGSPTVATPTAAPAAPAGTSAAPAGTSAASRQLLRALY